MRYRPTLVLIIAVSIVGWLLSTPPGLLLRKFLAQQFEYVQLSFHIPSSTHSFIFQRKNLHNKLETMTCQILVICLSFRAPRATNTHFSSYLIRKFYPLPPGNYVPPSDDYGMRLGQNWQRFRQSSPVLHESPPKSTSAQSKSVGGFLRESPLDNAPRRIPVMPHVESFLDDEPSEAPPARSPVAKLRTPSGHRSRSLTLPPKATTHEDASEDVDDSELSTVAFDDDESPYSALPSGAVSIPRPSSNPIHIGTATTRSQRRESDASFPMTDGAMAEYAALASTPASNPGILI